MATRAGSENSDTAVTLHDTQVIKATAPATATKMAVRMLSFMLLLVLPDQFSMAGSILNGRINSQWPDQFSMAGIKTS
jgi:hypothetical protein